MSQKKIIRVLLVDDSADDRELILLNLRRGGYSPDYLGVDTKEDFVNALDTRKWDLILCDYSMPGFDGITALNILTERDRDIPFILISGAIGEELAVKAMKAGAHDYLMKDNLQRLVPAVEREINEAENRMKQREAERERDRLSTVIQHSLNEIYIFDSNTFRFRYLNQAAISNLGYSESEIPNLTPIDISPQIDNRLDFERIIAPLRAGELEKELYVTKHTRKDGSTYPIEIHLQLIRQGGEQFFTAIGFDMTDREKDARRIKEQKEIAREFALHSKYKSEFLANMSHELRTPLNSIILLSKLLLKAKDKNLTADQANFVDVIHQSGNNLLELINEVLDLSKIESGEMEISLGNVEPESLLDNIDRIFSPLADEKDITFEIIKSDEIPERLVTDRMRVDQVLKNLLSNAFKFTENGSITLEMFRRKSSSHPGESMIGFSVKDTGIGIPEDKQSLIFESFRQVDGSTQRRYGGTGLGLSICKKISSMLGGSISVRSSEGKGSTFTFLIPINSEGKVIVEHRKSKKAISDEQGISQQEHTLESSPQNVKENGTTEPTAKNIQTVLVATNSEYVKSHLPNSGHFDYKFVENGDNVCSRVLEIDPAVILIDPFIPNRSGWTLAKMLSGQSSAPVWFIAEPGKTVPKLDYSFVKGELRLPFTEERISGLITKNRPAGQPNTGNTLLLIDDNRMHNTALREFAADVVDKCVTAESAKEAFNVLHREPVHCIVLDLTLPDASGADILKQLSEDERFENIPVIIYSGRSLTNADKSALMERASDVILKNVGSHSKLMKKITELTGLSDSPEPQVQPADSENLEGKTLLIVDDDKHSYLALSSHLNDSAMTTIHAATGEEAISALQSNPSIDLVLMDVMMPDMDGLDLLKEIRENRKLRKLPIISVTAKAMSGDRENCLSLGATDYVSKPVDPDKLIALLTVWAE